MPTGSGSSERWRGRSSSGSRPSSDRWTDPGPSGYREAHARKSDHHPYLSAVLRRARAAAPRERLASRALLRLRHGGLRPPAPERRRSPRPPAVPGPADLVDGVQRPEPDDEEHVPGAAAHPELPRDLRRLPPPLRRDRDGRARQGGQPRAPRRASERAVRRGVGGRRRGRPRRLHRHGGLVRAHGRLHPQLPRAPAREALRGLGPHLDLHGDPQPQARGHGADVHGARELPAGRRRPAPLQRPLLAGAGARALEHSVPHPAPRGLPRVPRRAGEAPGAPQRARAGHGLRPGGRLLHRLPGRRLRLGAQHAGARRWLGGLHQPPPRDARPRRPLDFPDGGPGRPGSLPPLDGRAGGLPGGEGQGKRPGAHRAGERLLRDGGGIPHAGRGRGDGGRHRRDPESLSATSASATSTAHRADPRAGSSSQSRPSSQALTRTSVRRARP